MFLLLFRYSSLTADVTEGRVRISEGWMLDAGAKMLDVEGVKNRHLHRLR